MNASIHLITRILLSVMKKLQQIIIVLALGSFFSGGMLAQTNIERMFPNLVLTREQYNKWKSAIDSTTTSDGKTAFDSFVRLLSITTIRDDVTPSPVTSLSVSGASAIVASDMQRMYALCLYYAFTQSDVYLAKAKQFYLAWAAVNTAVKENSPGETIYNPGIEGYSIIRNCIDSTSRVAIDAWMRKRAAVASADGVRTNNWQTIRLQFLLYYGLLLNDASILTKFSGGYDPFIPINLYPNGTSIDLLGRDAFAYHAYDLLFFAKILKAEACYYGFAKADSMYAKEYQWGSSIKKSVDFWKPYLLYPTKYSHIEFLETEYTPDIASHPSEYNKPYNPSGTIYVVDEMYLLDQDLFQAIKLYRGNTKTATLALWLSALRWN